MLRGRASTDMTILDTIHWTPKVMHLLPGCIEEMRRSHSGTSLSLPFLSLLSANQSSADLIKNAWKVQNWYSLLSSYLLCTAVPQPRHPPSLLPGPLGQLPASRLAPPQSTLHTAARITRKLIASLPCVYSVVLYF